MILVLTRQILCKSDIPHIFNDVTYFVGRIVSPPHSSDFSTEIEPDVNDSLSSREVNLKSRTSQFTQQNTLPAFLSDQDSLYSQLTQKTLSDKTWAKPVKQPYNKTFQNFEKTISSSGRERHSKEFSISDQLSLKSNVTSTATAPDFASLKVRSTSITGLIKKIH